MKIDYEEMKKEITMRDVLHLVGFHPNEIKGDQLRGPCPIHKARPESRSFSVNLLSKKFQCFSCKEKGNHLDLYMQANSIHSPYEAVALIASKLHLPIYYLER